MKILIKISLLFDMSYPIYYNYTQMDIRRGLVLEPEFCRLDSTHATNLDNFSNKHQYLQCEISASVSFKIKFFIQIVLAC